MTQLEKKIDIQERKYRYITTLLLNDQFHKYYNTIKQHQMKYHVDMSLTASTYTDKVINTYDIEFKERNKNIESSPYAELKVSKYKEMQKAYTNNTLLYIVYCDEIAYIYDLTKINMDDLERFQWKIKKTQYSNNDNDTTIEETYKIPVNLATKVNCFEYFEKYNQLIEEEQNAIHKLAS